jgi:hypothetical protein
MRTPGSRAGTVAQTVLALAGVKVPTQSANLGPSYVAGLHLHEGAVRNPCVWCGDLRDRAPAGLLTGACPAVGGAAVRFAGQPPPGSVEDLAVISARVRSRAARSTDDRSCSVWLMIAPCRSARSIAKLASSAQRGGGQELRPLHPVSTWTPHLARSGGGYLTA